MKKKMAVWYAPDQAYTGKNAVLVDFCGVPAMSNPATTQLLKASGASLLPFLPSRLPDDSGYKIEFLPIVDNISLLPGKEFPLDEKGIANFRRQWHEQFDVDHRQCTIYQDVSQGIAPAGIEYYLPLFFDQCGTLFDYLPENTLLLTTESVNESVEAFWQECNERYEMHRHDIERPLLTPQQVFLQVDETFAAIVKAVEDGRISIDRIEDANRRSLGVKYDYKFFEEKSPVGIKDPAHAADGINDPKTIAKINVSWGREHYGDGSQCFTTINQPIIVHIMPDGITN